MVYGCLWHWFSLTFSIFPIFSIFCHLRSGFPKLPRFQGFQGFQVTSPAALGWLWRSAPPRARATTTAPHATADAAEMPQSWRRMATQILGPTWQPKGTMKISSGRYININIYILCYIYIILYIYYIYYIIYIDMPLNGIFTVYSTIMYYS